MKCLFGSFAHSSIKLPFSYWFVESCLLYTFEYIYWKYFILSRAVGIHIFNDIPKVGPCESIRVVMYYVAQVSLFFIGDGDLGASFC